MFWKNCGTLARRKMCVHIWCACIWGRWIKAVQVYRRKATHFDKERVLSFSPLRLQYFWHFFVLVTWACSLVLHWLAFWRAPHFARLQVKSLQRSCAACHPHLEEFTLCVPQSPQHRYLKCCGLHLKSALCCTVLFPAASSALEIYINIYMYCREVLIYYGGDSCTCYPCQYSR